MRSASHWAEPAARERSALEIGWGAVAVDPTRAATRGGGVPGGSRTPPLARAAHRRGGGAARVVVPGADREIARLLGQRAFVVDRCQSVPEPTLLGLER